jgi:nucleoside-diphosphate-sugar epimerase
MAQEPSNTNAIVGLGFVGKHLAAELLGRSDHNLVTAVDTYEPSLAFHMEKMQRWQNEPRFNYLWKSAGDTAGLGLHTYDNIIYTAAMADVPFALNNPLSTMQTNVMNLTAFMEYLRVKDFKGRFILLSSEAVYGKQPEELMPLKEDSVIPSPDTIYAISKYCQENVVRGFCQTYGIPYIVLRSATMFGEFSRLKQVIPIFTTQCLRGEKITIEGDGSQTRDFNYVMNMVTAIISLIENENKQIWNTTYNIGSGSEIRIINIATAIRSFVGGINPTGKPSEIELKPWRAGEQGKRVALSIEKAKKAFDYFPYVKTLDGIKNVIIWLAWYHENFDPGKIEELRKMWPSGQAFEQEHKIGYGDINPEKVDEYPDKDLLTPEQLQRIERVGKEGEAAATPEKTAEERRKARIEEISDQALEDYQKALTGGS